MPQVLFAQSAGQVNRKAASRNIPQTAWRVLDAPNVNNDYYLNLLDWSENNHLCVALDNSVFLWNASDGEIMELCEVSTPSHDLCPYLVICGRIWAYEKHPNQ